MITQKLVVTLTSYGNVMQKFQESQETRALYIHEARKAGQLLLEVQEDFKSEGYCTAKPLIIKDKAYTSFTKLLEDFKYLYEELVEVNVNPELEEYFKDSHATKCMTLARKWNLAEEIVDLFSIKHTYRLSKTLEIIAWYDKKKKDNPDVDPTLFTCKLYWEEQEAERQARQEDRASKLTYKQLQAELEHYKQLLDQKDRQIAELQKMLRRSVLESVH